MPKGELARAPSEEMIWFRRSQLFSAQRVDCDDKAQTHTLKHDAWGTLIS
jgi:hypothetical protein